MINSKATKLKLTKEDVNFLSVLVHSRNKLPSNYLLELAEKQLAGEAFAVAELLIRRRKSHGLKVGGAASAKKKAAKVVKSLKIDRRPLSAQAGSASPDPQEVEEVAAVFESWAKALI